MFLFCVKLLEKFVTFIRNIFELAINEKVPLVSWSLNQHAESEEIHQAGEVLSPTY